MSILAQIAQAAARVPPNTAIEVDPVAWNAALTELKASVCARMIMRGRLIVGQFEGRQGFALINRLVLKRALVNGY